MLRRTLSLLFIFSFSFFLASSQSIGLRLSSNYGGTDLDRAKDVQKTTDGGYLLVGETVSNNGNITNNHGYTDAWVTKLNADGLPEWSKCYGGSRNESVLKSIFFPDDSLLIAGITYSYDSVQYVTHGITADIYLTKINADGDIIWRKFLGGTENDYLNDIQLLPDGSYILAGYTYSTDGDISGQHGGEDIWIVKLSATGDIQWQKTLGGSGNERPAVIKPTADGNYIVAGYTASANGDASTHGGLDAWVIKLSATGTIVWQKAFGGTNADVATGVVVSDNNLVVAAYTASSNGDVIGHKPGSSLDIWVLNIDYATGNLIWQKCFGGNNNETLKDIQLNADGSYILLGQSSSINGDIISHGQDDVILAQLANNGTLIWVKTYGGILRETPVAIINDLAAQRYMILAVTNSPETPGFHKIDTLQDAWVFRTNYAGDIDWQRSIGGRGTDFYSLSDQLYSIKKAGLNEYLLAGATSSMDGDLKKSQGYIDAWLVKLSGVNYIDGKVFIDYNLNNTREIDEPLYPWGTVTNSKPGDTTMMYAKDGYFKFEVDTGSYKTVLSISQPDYYSFGPVSKDNVFTTYDDTISFDFYLHPIAGKKNLTIHLLPITPSRPGFNTTYKLNYSNAGTETIANGEITFKKDSRLNLLSTIPAYTSVSGDTIKWSYTNLKPLDTASIIINLSVQPPPAVNIGDTLNSVAFIDPVGGDLVPFDDTSIVKQIVVGSLDPNEKSEANGGKINRQYILNQKYLNYMIRFQNMGTDTAFNIVVIDTLDTKLDWTTLEILDASNDYTLEIKNGNQLIFRFNNIKLPDHNVDEPASHGFIAYRIKPLGAVSEGDIIHNTASIYFDFNLPVVTNDATTLVAPNLMTLPVALLNFAAEYRQSHTNLEWLVTDEIGVKVYEMERSTDGIHFAKIGEVKATGGTGILTYEFSDDLSGRQERRFFYRLRIIDEDGNVNYSRVVAISIDKQVQNQLTINPNPAIRGLSSTIMISYSADVNANFQVISMNGQVLNSWSARIKKGSNVLPFEVGNLPMGSYVLRMQAPEGGLIAKFLIR